MESHFVEEYLMESHFVKRDLMESPFRSTELTTKSKGKLNRMAGRLCRTCRFLSLFFFLIMPSLFLADTADAAWGTATVNSAGDTGLYTSIAVGTSGAAYISYYDQTNGNLMYATNVSGSWGTTTVDSAGDTGLYTSIAVGTSGAAYISYYDQTNGNLMYATNVSGSWGTTTVDSAGVRGQYTSIAVGSEYISYYDSSNGNLMYATTALPTVTTGAASNVTTNSATLAGTVNGKGLSATAMFSYGVASGSYTGTSTTQSGAGQT